MANDQDKGVIDTVLDWGSKIVGTVIGKPVAFIANIITTLVVAIRSPKVLADMNNQDLRNKINDLNDKIGDGNKDKDSAAEKDATAEKDKKGDKDKGDTAEKNPVDTKDKAEEEPKNEKEGEKPEEKDGSRQDAGDDRGTADSDNKGKEEKTGSGKYRPYFKELKDTKEKFVARTLLPMPTEYYMSGIIGNVRGFAEKNGLDCKEAAFAKNSICPHIRLDGTEFSVSYDDGSNKVMIEPVSNPEGYDEKTLRIMANTIFGAITEASKSYEYMRDPDAPDRIDQGILKDRGNEEAVKSLFTDRKGKLNLPNTLFKAQSIAMTDYCKEGLREYISKCSGATIQDVEIDCYTMDTSYPASMDKDGNQDIKKTADHGFLVSLGNDNQIFIGETGVAQLSGGYMENYGRIAEGVYNYFGHIYDPKADPEITGKESPVYDYLLSLKTPEIRRGSNFPEYIVRNLCESVQKGEEGVSQYATYHGITIEAYKDPEHPGTVLCDCGTESLARWPEQKDEFVNALNKHYDVLVTNVYNNECIAHGIEIPGHEEEQENGSEQPIIEGATELGADGRPVAEEHEETDELSGPERDQEIEEEELGG